MDDSKFVVVCLVHVEVLERSPMISDVTFFSVLQLFVLCFKEKDATEDENEAGQHMFQQITRTYSPKRMQD